MTWKRIGSSTPPPKPPAAPSEGSASSSSSSASAEPSAAPLPIPIPPPLPNFNRRAPPPPNVDPLARLISARAGLVDDEPELIDNNKFKLSLEGDVVRWMLKKMEETWAEFYEQIDDTTMLFPRLTLFFGPIHRRQIPQEMEWLVLSGNSGYNKDWVMVINIIFF